MTRTALSVLFASLVAAGSATAGEFEAWGPVIAGHELRALDGTAARVADLRGEVVVLNFWASWCKPCKRELVELDALTSRVRGHGVRVMAVSIDQDVRKAERFVANAGLSLPVYHDGVDGLARELDLPWLPCTVVLDAQGRIVRVDGGGTPETLAAIERAVLSLTGAAPASAGGEAG